MKIFKKIERSISKCMIFACHRLGKTMKTIVDFANRKDAELVLKSKKKLEDKNLLEICSNTNGNQNCGLSSPERDSKAENVDVSEKNWDENFIYIKVSAPVIGSFMIRLRNDIMKDSFTTSG